MSNLFPLEEQLRCVYAAMQHLQHGRSLIDIAAELEVSRFKAGRMVQRARDAGLVEVTPRLPDLIDTDLSQRLTRHFALQAAVVVRTSTEDPAQVRAHLAQTGARVVSETIEEDDILGLASGRTIVEMCRLVEEFPVCDVVQLTGVAAADWEQGMQAIVTLGLVAGRMYPLHAPFITTDEASARAITSQPGTRRSLQRLGHLDKAVLSIGGWPHSSLLAGQLAEWGELGELEELGVVAEIGTTLLGRRGDVISELTGRTIGITTEQLTAVPLRIAIGGGPGKADAALAVLRSGLVDIVVTDAATAHHALTAEE